MIEKTKVDLKVFNAKYVPSHPKIICSGCGFHIDFKGNPNRAHVTAQCPECAKWTTDSQYNKILRESYITKGLCFQGCGRQLAPNSKSRCIECLSKLRESYKKRKLSKIMASSA
jgi:hypothetical protein